MTVAPNTKQQAIVMKQLQSFSTEDITPFASFEIPKIYTLVARPPEDVRVAISRVSDHLQLNYPEHYYYPSAQYHATLLAVSNTVDQESIDIIQRVIKRQHVEVSLQGLGISAHGVSVPVYAHKPGALGHMRNELRDKLHKVPDTRNKGTPWDELSWINFVRFTSKPSPHMLDDLRKYESTQFGTFSIDTWELYKTTSRVLDPACSELVERFTV